MERQQFDSTKFKQYLTENKLTTLSKLEEAEEEKAIEDIIQPNSKLKDLALKTLELAKYEKDALNENSQLFESKSQRRERIYNYIRENRRPIS